MCLLTVQMNRMEDRETIKLKEKNYNNNRPDELRSHREFREQFELVMTPEANICKTKIKEKIILKFIACRCSRLNIDRCAHPRVLTF